MAPSGLDDTDFWYFQHNFYVGRNELHGYQCNYLGITTEKASLSSIGNGPLIQANRRLRNVLDRISERTVEIYWFNGNSIRSLEKHVRVIRLTLERNGKLSKCNRWAKKSCSESSAHQLLA